MSAFEGLLWCRSLTLAAQDGLLQEGFFFVPSLGGPATIDQQLNGQGMSWLLPFVDGAPPLGWVTTLKYVALPVLLVASQYASMSISQPANSDDPSVKQTQAILKYLPIMIGTFVVHLAAYKANEACVNLLEIFTILCACRILCAECASWPDHLLAHKQRAHHSTTVVPQESHQN